MAARSALRKEGKTLEEDEYISLVGDVISILPENVVIHRLTGDGDKKILISPVWSCDKRRVLNLINHELKVRNIFQGENKKKKNRLM